MTIQGTLREVLSARISGAGFSQYFAFIESCPPRDKAGSEYHHILPKTEFPDQAKNQENLIYLSVGDHLRAHYWLALCAPNHALFQRIFFAMSGLKKYASNVSKTELEHGVEVYERGKEAQRAATRLRRARFINLAGETIGRLSVLQPTRTKGGRPAWECQCTCGKTTVIGSDQLLSERTKSCGCLRSRLRYLDLTRQVFGRLTVLKPTGISKHRMQWNCVCSCGKTAMVSSIDLTSEHTRSCGCLRADMMRVRGPKILRQYVNGGAHA